MYVLFNGPKGPKLLTIDSDGGYQFHGADLSRAREEARALQPEMVGLIERIEALASALSIEKAKG